MLKAIALAGVFLFTSAASSAALTTSPQKKVAPVQAPAAPQPQGFCIPAGSHC